MAAIARDRPRRGLVAVEAAIVLPLLLLLTFALIEYGWLFMKTQQMTNAARRGARLAVRADSTTSEVQAAIAAIMTTAGLEGSGYVVTISPADVGALESGEPLTVQITVPYANVTLTGLPFVPVPANLKGSVTMAKEGP